MPLPSRTAMADAPHTLNPAQLQAVHHLHGPCLVLAGAGSGKTRVIVHKIARLLQAGLAPKEIAAITFTNKAAQEMRERAKSLVGPRAAKDLAVSTFHSLGVRLLREDGAAVGLKPKYSILDSDDVMGVLREAGGASDNKLARQWQWTISLWKNMGLNSDGAAAIAKDADEQVAARVMKLYEERLAAYQAVDFDDLISLPLKLLQKDAAARDKWQARFRHVLVDEYQDTNAVQYELLKVLVSHPDERLRGRFTAVGDDDQSIYGWRGATIDNLKRLPQDWPELKVIPLEQNYRSTGNILRAANNVIAGNPKLFEKKLWSEFGDAIRCAWWNVMVKSTKPSARWLSSNRCAPKAVRWLTTAPAARSSSVISPSSTVPTTWRGRLRNNCAPPTSPTKSQAGKAFLTAPKSRTCALGCGCWSTRMTTRRFCALSPHPSVASATPRWANWVSSRTSTRSACSRPCSAKHWPRNWVPKPSIHCMSLAATSMTWNTAPAAPPALKTPRSCCMIG